MSASRSVAVPPWVPADMRAQVDLSELAAEDPLLSAECARLGLLLDAHVAAYRRGAQGRPGGLCSYYRVTNLRPTQVRELMRAELRFPLVVFVAYRSPLERHPGGASADE